MISFNNKYNYKKIMKKVIFFLIIVFSVSFILTGCTKKQENQQNQNKKEVPSEFTKPEKQPDISGIVKSIVGNEVIIIKIDITSTASTDSVGDVQEKQNQAKLSLGTSSGRPSGGPGMGMRPSGGEGMDDESRAQMLAKIKEMSTGEEKVIIPVGIQMLKSGTSSNSRVMVEASLSDIVPDKMLMIWLDPNVSDRKLANFVEISR